MKRCKMPVKAEQASEDLGFGGASGSGAGDGGWEKANDIGGSAQPAWESNNAEASTFAAVAPIATVGGGW